MREAQLDRQRIRRRRKRRRKRRRRLFFRTLFSLLFFGTILLGGIRIVSRLPQSDPPVSGLSYAVADIKPEAYLSDGRIQDIPTDREETVSVETVSAETASVETASGETASAETADRPYAPLVDLTQLNLNSSCAILTDAETGEILGEHNGQEQIYPASLTKLMTALLAIEHTSDFSETVTVPDSIFPDLYAQNASMAGFQPGETASLEDLLYGVLLPSGAECSLTFALRIAGSEEAFVGLMNEKAAALGMEHTHFANATGLHDPEHYSTVHDLSLLLRFCLQDETFRTVFTTFRHSTAPSAQHPDGFTFFSTLSPDLEEGVFSGGEILGGKTGYTQEAGLCLASLAQIQGREYLLVTAGAPGDHQSDPLHVRDAAEVYGQLALSLER